MKQRRDPGVRPASALVVDQAVIDRAPGRNQSASRRGGIRDHIRTLELGAGLSDVECRAAEYRLQLVADAERKASDRRHDVEPLALHMGADRLGQGGRSRCLAGGSDGRP